MAKKKIDLTPTQIAHLVNSTIKNMIDFQIHFNEDDTMQFLLILDCMFPEECIAITKEPHGKEESFDIMHAHAVPELAEFFSNCMRVKWEDNKHYRAFDTIPIGKHNLADFISALSEIDGFWAALDQDIENEADLKKKTAGKNVVEGNGTVQ